MFVGCIVTPRMRDILHGVEATSIHRAFVQCVCANFAGAWKAVNSKKKGANATKILSPGQVYRNRKLADTQGCI